MILLRFLRRRASLEASSPADFCDVELRLADGDYDLSPSVYEIDDQSATIARACAEHCANAGMDPQRAKSGVDVAGIAPRPPTPTENSRWFAFLNAVHREIRVRDAAELLDIAAVVLTPPRTRRRDVSRDAVRDYVRARLSGQDPEWNRFCAEAPRGRRWQQMAP